MRTQRHSCFQTYGGEPSSAIENLLKGDKPTPNADYLVLRPADLTSIAKLALHDLLRVLADDADDAAQRDVTLEVLRLVCRQDPARRPRAVAAWGPGPGLGGAAGGYFTNMSLSDAEPARIQGWIDAHPQAPQLQAHGRAELGRRVVVRMRESPGDPTVAAWGLQQLAFVAAHVESLAALRNRAGSLNIFNTVFDAFARHVGRKAVSPDDGTARDALRVLAGVARAAAHEVMAGEGDLRTRTDSFDVEAVAPTRPLRAGSESARAPTESPGLAAAHRRLDGALHGLAAKPHFSDWGAVATGGVRAWALSVLRLTLPHILAVNSDEDAMRDGIELAGVLCTTVERTAASINLVEETAPGSASLPPEAATVALAAAASHPDLCAAAEGLARVFIDAKIAARFTMPRSAAAAAWAIRAMRANPCSRPLQELGCRLLADATRPLEAAQSTHDGWDADASHRLGKEDYERERARQLLMDEVANAGAPQVLTDCANTFADASEMVAAAVEIRQRLVGRQRIRSWEARLAGMSSYSGGRPGPGWQSTSTGAWRRGDRGVHARVPKPPFR